MPNINTPQLGMFKPQNPPSARSAKHGASGAPRREPFGLLGELGPRRSTEGSGPRPFSLAEGPVTL
eukprot:1055971-Alexandrium_andersonii.AAC.1